MNHVSITSIALPTLLLVCSAGTAQAQVQLDRFFPPVVAVGGEATIKAEGKFPAWPVEVVHDREDVKINLGSESGVFKVSVPPNAAPGVCWVRMHDAKSASKLVPILIDAIEPTLEKEPNNDLAAAATINLPALVVGRLEKGGEVDTFRVAVSAGQTLVVSTTAQRILRSPMDAVLQLVDLRGNVLFQADDVRGIDPQIVYQVRDDAELLVRIFAFPETPNSTIGFAGSSSFSYVLRVTTDSFVDHVLPLVAGSSTPVQSHAMGWNLPAKIEVTQHPATSISPTVAYAPGSLGWQWQTTLPNDATDVIESGDATETKSAQKPPLVYSGHISEPSEIDRVLLDFQKEKKYRISVHSQAFGFYLDSVLRLVDPDNGNEIARNDDRSRNQYDAVLEHSASKDGVVELQISDLVDGFGPRHAYSVLIEESTPSVTLAVSEDHYLVNADKSVEIPITVSRLQGFQAKLQISVEGLPAGVQAEAVVSEPKGNTAKSVKLKLTAAKDAKSFQGNIQIVGRVLDEQGNVTEESIKAFFQLRQVIQLTDIWLTVSL